MMRLTAPLWSLFSWARERARTHTHTHTHTHTQEEKLEWNDSCQVWLCRDGW